MLDWQYLTRTLRWANADGSAKKQYGQDGYRLELIKGQWRAVYDGDGIILGRGTLLDAQSLCETHAQAERERELEWRY